jgi:hypothetical protein
MSLTIIMKDPERQWVVCKQCGSARDARSGGSCSCGNIKAARLPDGAVMTVAQDSDDVQYD